MKYTHTCWKQVCDSMVKTLKEAPNGLVLGVFNGLAAPVLASRSLLCIHAVPACMYEPVHCMSLHAYVPPRFVRSVLFLTGGEVCAFAPGKMYVQAVIS
jgi:hypothetical protein